MQLYNELSSVKRPKKFLRCQLLYLSPHKLGATFRRKCSVEFSFLLEVNYGAVKHCQPLLSSIHSYYSNHVR